jgi:hypothetical protein
MLTYLKPHLHSRTSPAPSLALLLTLSLALLPACGGREAGSSPPSPASIQAPDGAFSEGGEGPFSDGGDGCDMPSVLRCCEACCSGRLACSAALAGYCGC